MPPLGTRLAGAYLPLLVSGTLAPLIFVCVPEPWAFWPDRADFPGIDIALNLALFTPLALARRPGMVVGCASALLLSICLEWIQRYVGRTPSLRDVTLNVLGYAVARVAHRTIPPCPCMPRLPRWVLRVGSATAVGWLLALAVWSNQERLPVDFSNWESMPAHLLNEKGAEYPFEGTLHRLEWRVDGQPLWTFDPETAPRWCRVAQTTWTPDGLTGSGGRIRVPKEVSAGWIQAMRHGRRCELAADLTLPDPLPQEARFFVVSVGPWTRNLSLSLRDSAMVFCLRTPVTGIDGGDPALEAPLAPDSAGRRIRIKAFLLDGIQGLDIDGIPRARRALVPRATRPPLGPLLPLWLGLAAQLAVLVFLRHRPPFGLLLLGAAATYAGTLLAGFTPQIPLGTHLVQGALLVWSLWAATRLLPPHRSAR